MVRPLMTDVVFLAQKALPADAGDLSVADDLLDTLTAHKDGCVGMAANMIGVNKAIIVLTTRARLARCSIRSSSTARVLTSPRRAVFLCRGSAGRGATGLSRSSGRTVRCRPM